jgi:hypothetical protein
MWVCRQKLPANTRIGSALTGLTLLWVIWCLWRRWQDRDARRALLGWFGVSVGLGVLLWLPPVVQQLTSDHGNLSILYGHFTDPPEEAVGLKTGLRVLLVHLNPWRLVTGADAMTGATAPGAVFALVWAAAVVVAWRSKVRALIRLDLVVAVALVLALISASRIFGFLWFYLVLWTWSITVLMLVGIGWAIAVAVSRRERGEHRRTLAIVGIAALSVVLVAALTSFVAESAQAEPPDGAASAMLRKLVPSASARLASGDEPGGGRAGKYWISWTDPFSLGGPGFGLVDALDRRGFDVGVAPVYVNSMTRGRAFPRSDATAEVHLAVGRRAIDEWRAKPKAVQIASEQPTAADRAEFRRLRARAIHDLRDAGLQADVRTIDGNLFMATVDQSLPEHVRKTLERMLNLGQPAAIFVEPTAGT